MPLSLPRFSFLLQFSLCLFFSSIFFLSFLDFLSRASSFSQLLISILLLQFFFFFFPAITFFSFFFFLFVSCSSLAEQIGYGLGSGQRSTPTSVMGERAHGDGGAGWGAVVAASTACGTEESPRLGLGSTAAQRRGPQ
jgi:hypothetical protein